MNKALIILLKNSLAFILIGTLVVFTNIYSQPDLTINNDLGILSPPKDSIKPDSIGGFYKEEVIDSIISMGKTFLGLHYRYGGRTPAGFDCSGYVSYLFANFGYKLPTSSSAMVSVGEHIPYEDARKGDLILFNGRSTKTKSVGHVAIIIDVDSLGVVMLHSNHRGVTIDRYPQMPYYSNRFVGVRRVKL